MPDLLHSYKKCPECFANIPLNANRCPECKLTVGPPDIHGIARKPVNWKGYLGALVAWVALAIFVWWAFLRSK